MDDSIPRRLTPGVDRSEKDWWRQAIIYQIYPRSFADANGDGIGDLKGITSRAGYLKNLGVDGVWLSPFYPSELADGGYDVIDYRDVDPRIGTLEDFDEMVTTLKEDGIKVMVDIVPNHSSNKHPWFQEALKSKPGSAARARYHFMDGAGPNKDQPPNDWRSEFGGSIWSPSGQNDGQYYLHVFAKEQPDFNWDNPEVGDDFVKTIKFWADRGVAGFRVDVAGMLAKDLSQPFKSWKELEEIKWRMEAGMAKDNEHPLFGRMAAFEVYKRWRREVFDKYDPPLFGVAEAHGDLTHRHLWKAPDGLGQTFIMESIKLSLNASAVKTMINSCLKSDKETGSTTCYTYSSHDLIRHASRYGFPFATKLPNSWNDISKSYNDWLVNEGKSPHVDRELGLRRARALILALLAVPGSTYLYQGEELGLPEVVDIPADKRQDPMFHRTHHKSIGRDGCRVPLPWTKDGKNFGFGSGAEAHLPQPKWFAEYAVDQQDEDTSSTLEMYRKALKIRKGIKGEGFEWLPSGRGVEGEKSEDGGVLRWKREDIEVVWNFDKNTIDVGGRDVLVASDAVTDGRLQPWTSVWLKA